MKSWAFLTISVQLSAEADTKQRTKTYADTKNGFWLLQSEYILTVRTDTSTRQCNPAGNCNTSRLATVLTAILECCSHTPHIFHWAWIETVTENANTCHWLLQPALEECEQVRELEFIGTDLVMLMRLKTATSSVGPTWSLRGFRWGTRLRRSSHWWSLHSFLGILVPGLCVGRCLCGETNAGVCYESKWFFFFNKKLPGTKSFVSVFSANQIVFWCDFRVKFSSRGGCVARKCWGWERLAWEVQCVTPGCPWRTQFSLGKLDLY